jgi:hypothetical protein
MVERLVEKWASWMALQRVVETVLQKVAVKAVLLAVVRVDSMDLHWDFQLADSKAVSMVGVMVVRLERSMAELKVYMMGDSMVALWEF